MPRPLIIDFHAHFSDEDVFDRTASRNVANGFGAVTPDKTTARIRAMLNADIQVEEMDRRGIDVHVISSTQVIVGTWWADAATAADILRRQNDRAAEWVGRYPDRFIGAFDLPLQSMDLAFAELERAQGLGLKVANLPASFGDHYLGDPPFHALWAEMERRGITVFIHPDGVKDKWYLQFGMWNSIGQSIEEVRVMTSMIYQGVFEKFPALKVVMAHGGGFLPHYMGRLERNVINMPRSMVNITKNPSAYLRNFYYDTCVYDLSVLKSLVERIGVDRIVMGGDYPVGNHPKEFLDEADFLTQAQKDRITTFNTADLLGLEKTTTT